MRTLPLLMGVVGFSFLAVQDAHSQSMTGRLLDDDSNEPIIGAAVTVLDEMDRVVSRALTDSEGLFRFELVRGGQYRLRAERIGYQSSTTALPDVQANEPLNLEFRLSTQAILLDPLTVVARPWWEAERPRRVWGFYERMDRFGRTGFGRFITREDLTTQRHSPVWVVASNQFGFGIRIQLERNGAARAVKMRGPFGDLCTPEYFVDGLPFRADEWVIHDTIEAWMLEDRIEGIELFNPWYVPSEFDAECAVAIWTRGN